MNLQKRGLGLETRNVLTVHIPLNEERYSKGYAAFRLGIEAAFRNLPGVTAVGMSNSLPPDGESWHAGGRYSDIFVVGKSPSPQGTGGTVVVRSVTPDYFRVLRIPILQGPGFIESERNGSREFLILSQLLASRLFPGEDPVGRQIQFGTFDPYFKADPTIFTVAGVAGNVTNAGLKGQDAPEYYRLRHNADLDWSQHHYFLLESALPPSALGPMIRSAVARLDPSAPVEIGSLTQDVDRLSDRPRFEAVLLGFFALCGLAMAVIGVYGIMAYLATQRTREIGVRMALGATRMNILRLISMEGMRLVCIGGVIGIGLSLAASKLVESLLFGVAPHDPATYCGVALLLALVALLATLIPARAAMRVDPVEALRSE
jgi:predicted permease